MNINEFATLTDFEKTVLIKEQATFLNRYTATGNSVYIYSLQYFFIKVVINFAAVTYQITASEEGFMPVALLRSPRINFTGKNNFFGNLN